MHLIGQICRPLFHHHCIIPHYSLTYSLADALPPSIPAFYPSLHPSLSATLLLFAGLYLLTCLRGNYHSSERLSYCTAMLCFAFLHPYRTHIHTDMNSHKHARTAVHTQTSLHETSLSTPNIPPAPASVYSSNYCASPVIYYVMHGSTAVGNTFDVAVWTTFMCRHCVFV